MTDKLKGFLERHNYKINKWIVNTKHRGFSINKIIN